MCEFFGRWLKALALRMVVRFQKLRRDGSPKSALPCEVLMENLMCKDILQKGTAVQVSWLGLWRMYSVTPR